MQMVKVTEYEYSQGRRFDQQKIENHLPEWITQLKDEYIQYLQQKYNR